ncbi:MAG: hypothetical protein KBH15_03705 [Candidatus Atribacteria bacterium]|nr:hypothetical protein [Candidatus Atribacteria bacterium]
MRVKLKPITGIFWIEVHTTVFYQMTIKILTIIRYSEEQNSLRSKDRAGEWESGRAGEKDLIKK